MAAGCPLKRPISAGSSGKKGCIYVSTKHKRHELGSRPREQIFGSLVRERAHLGVDHAASASLKSTHQ